jgi:dipeptidyl aminopeptidase/acylaminoacyl peptidase
VLDELALHTVEEITFTGAEGHPVQMFVLHPPAAAAGPRPLVHMIHGGPHGVFGDGWHWRWCAHVFGAPGYVVALVNFHGSTSWGQTFARCIQGRWGDQPYKDIMAATDLLIERGIADPARMAATGGSYGGYMASWIASQTDRFACIINHAGVCDLQLEWASDITQGWEDALGGAPWANLDGMDRWNPMRHAAGFKSPMLVIHGEQDYRVPYDQGLQIYNVYKAMRLPARLVCYPDENHWILKPRNNRHWYGEFQSWLARWLG